MNSILRRSSRSSTLLLLQNHFQSSSSSSSRFVPTFNQQNQFFSTSLLGNRVSYELNPGKSISKEKPVLTQIRFFASSLSSIPASDSINLDATERLKRVIEEELECCEAVAEADLQNNPGDSLEPLLDPRKCPFDVVDNPGEQAIILKRKYGDERIQIEVDMPGEEDDLGDDNEDSDDVQEDDHDGQGKPEFSIPMKVTISKGDGPSLELCCFGIPKDIDIYSISLVRPEVSPDQIPYKPEFLDLDEYLRKSFESYLERRGITGSLANDLHKYMTKKEGKEYTEWLKSMKEFIES